MMCKRFNLVLIVSAIVSTSTLEAIDLNQIIDQSYDHIRNSKPNFGYFSFRDGKFYTISLDDNINFRSNPSTSSTILGKINKSEISEFLDKSEKKETIGNNTGRWYKIRRYDSTEGYVFGVFFLVFQNSSYNKDNFYHLASAYDPKVNQPVIVELGLESELKNDSFELRVTISGSTPMRGFYSTEDPPLTFTGEMDGPGISVISKMEYDLKTAKYTVSQYFLRTDDDGSEHRNGTESNRLFLDD